MFFIKVRTRISTFCTVLISLENLLWLFQIFIICNEDFYSTHTVGFEYFLRTLFYIWEANITLCPI